MERSPTKGNLIECAITCAAENGLENTTTKKIAAVANVSEATIYRHFESKEELLKEAFLEVENTGLLHIVAPGFCPDPLPDKKASARQLWNRLIEYHTDPSRSERTRYYIMYYFSGMYNDDADARRLLKKGTYTEALFNLQTNFGFNTRRKNHILPLITFISFSYLTASEILNKRIEALNGEDLAFAVGYSAARAMCSVLPLIPGDCDDDIPDDFDFILGDENDLPDSFKLN